MKLLFYPHAYRPFNCSITKGSTLQVSIATKGFIASWVSSHTGGEYQQNHAEPTSLANDGATLPVQMTHHRQQEPQTLSADWGTVSPLDRPITGFVGVHR